MGDYQYDRFSAGAYDLDQFSGPAPGSRAPDFKVTALDGKTADLLDFDGEFLVLEMGSITCPLFQSRRGGMAGLARANPDISFVVLYIREAHPGQKISQPKDFATKLACARSLKAEDGEGRRILIDDMDGHAHTAYGSYPNPVFIINRAGCVVYMSDWNNPAATARALRRLRAGRAAGAAGLFLPALPWVARRTLKRAGQDALVDFVKNLPRLIWKNVIKRNLRVLLGRKAQIAPDHVC